MPRPKKSKPTHSSGMYSYTTTVGHAFDGHRIRKVFYSSKSKADAKRKADEYIINQKVSQITGDVNIDKHSTFSKIAESYLTSVKATLTDKAYENYEIAVRVHLLPFFKDAVMENIKAC